MNSKLETYLNSPAIHIEALQSLFAKSAALVILDIGSCEGEDSIRYSRLFPNSQIYAFEPLAKNIERIHRNIEDFSTNNITVVAAALGESEGKATFYVSSGRPDNTENEDWDYGNKSSSLLPPDKTRDVHAWLLFKEQITVPTTTLLKFVQLNKLDRIDFIHMDIQGAELMALRGAGDFLPKIKAVWLEVEATSLYKDQPLKQDIEAFMAKNNFYKLIDTVDSVAGDQFYVNKAYFTLRLPILIIKRQAKNVVRGLKSKIKSMANLNAPKK